jgi:hypothetical protein
MRDLGVPLEKRKNAPDCRQGILNGAGEHLPVPAVVFPDVSGHVQPFERHEAGKELLLFRPPHTQVSKLLAQLAESASLMSEEGIMNLVPLERLAGLVDPVEDLPEELLVVGLYRVDRDLILPDARSGLKE